MTLVIELVLMWLGITGLVFGRLVLELRALVLVPLVVVSLPRTDGTLLQRTPEVLVRPFLWAHPLVRICRLLSPVCRLLIPPRLVRLVL